MKSASSIRKPVSGDGQMELVKFWQAKRTSYTMKESLRALKTNIQFCGMIYARFL